VVTLTSASILLCFKKRCRLGLYGKFDGDGVGAGCEAEGAIAGLVADKNVEGASILQSSPGKREVEMKDGGGVEKAGGGVEGGITRGAGLGFGNPSQLGRVSFSEGDGRGDGTAGRLLKGIEVPPRGEASGEVQLEFGSGPDRFRRINLPGDRRRGCECEKNGCEKHWTHGAELA